MISLAISSQAIIAREYACLATSQFCAIFLGGIFVNPRLHYANFLLVGVVGAGCVFLSYGTSVWKSSSNGHMLAASETAKITVDYPVNGSVFPPEITPPTFLFRDPAYSAKRWIIEVSFADPAAGIRVETPGEFMQSGKIDPAAGPGTDLTPEQAGTRTWKPEPALWAKIKRLSVKSPAKIAIRGYADSDAKSLVSVGSVTISTSEDPVGAPIFYRDVPLKAPGTAERGAIQPLPQSALPLIKWQVRNIAEPQSHTVMKNLPTCANCHSFSADGKTLGLDLDGPRNDKGLYALSPVARNMTIRNQDVIRWSSFQVDPEVKSIDPSVKRFGFMSQVSPDARYVITSIGPRNAGNAHGKEIPAFAAGILDRLYSTNYKDFRFLQVFYPTRGILAWYDRKEQKMRPLPGADDPNFVQTSAFWSPDGKYLIFSRAAARDPYPPGAPNPQYANDPKEPQIQYDLYKIPFNEGRGGKAVPLEGASGNGMSNNFPKVSPDGKWIVFVENRNGLLMRPDSKLYIVPFAGGKVRPMTCNTSLMNSWHSFSPNGRWLAFSSKARSPFTQLMLTHIDAEGNDTPAILVENATASNRAVNIPEFVNIPPDGLENIDPQATEIYRLLDQAFELMQSKKIPEAIQAQRKALQLDPTDPTTHYHLAVLLADNKQMQESLEECRKASALDPQNTLYLEYLAASLAQNGDLEGGVGVLKRAIAIRPASAEYHDKLGLLLESQGDFTGAVGAFEKAVALSKGKEGKYKAALAGGYYKGGRTADAVQTAHEALDLAVENGDVPLENELLKDLEKYDRGK